MSFETTSKGQLGDLERLLASLTANAAELPHLDAIRNQLGTLLGQAREAADLQALHTAGKQEASRNLEVALTEGMRLANVLRLAVKHHYGIRSEKLAHFGIQPFRGRPFSSRTRKPKPAPEEPQTPAAPETPGTPIVPITG
jgi:hypothetical protein